MTNENDSIAELLYRKAVSVRHAEDQNPEVGMGMPLFYIVNVAKEQIERECELLGVDCNITKSMIDSVIAKLRGEPFE